MTRKTLFSSHCQLNSFSSFSFTSKISTFAAVYELKKPVKEKIA